MRISDWSSDVCSSDLSAHFRLGANGDAQGVGQALPGQPADYVARIHQRMIGTLVADRAGLRKGDEAEIGARRHRAQPAIAKARDLVFEPCAPLPVVRTAAADEGVVGKRRDGRRLPCGEIGRTACRESVCQYVLLSV